MSGSATAFTKLLIGLSQQLCVHVLACTVKQAVFSSTNAIVYLLHATHHVSQ